MNKNLISIILILSFTFVAGFSAKAQEDCTVKLNDAAKLYENGKIEQIPDLISGCLESGFNKEQKIQALRLLTLVYLFEDNAPKAEKTVLQLLKIDPEYKANQSIDPVEFIRLINSYNTAPVFSIGIWGSPLFTKPHLIETASSNNLADANPVYRSGGLSLSAGLKGIYHLNSNWDVYMEPSYSGLSYQLTENTTEDAVTTINESMNYINFPVYSSYKFYQIKKYSFFGEAGFSYDLFLNGNIGGNVVYKNNVPMSEPPSITSTQEIRKAYNLAGILGAGTKINLNRSNIQVNLRYKFGLQNIVNPESRVYQKLFYDYCFIDNDFSINNLCLTISYNIEFYIHNKKPNNQTNYDVIR